MTQKDGFVKGRLKSIIFALRGMKLLVTTEHSIMVQVSISILLCILGYVIGLSSIEWMFQLLAIGLVISVEALNTAVEKLADYIEPSYDKRIGFIKDIAAGGVAFAAIIAIIIGLFIYLPKFT